MDIEVFNKLNRKAYQGIITRVEIDEYGFPTDYSDDRTNEKNATAVYSFYNLKNIINSDVGNAIQDIAKSYEPIKYKYQALNGSATAYNASNRTPSVSLLHLPPVKKKSSTKFVAQRDLFYFIDATFRNELASVYNGIVSDADTKAFISTRDVDYLRDWLPLFYDEFYNNIDFNADDSAWLFDKEGYKEQLSKVEGFAAKLKEYVTAYDTAIANPSDLDAQAKVITLYNDIRKEKNNTENYYEHIKVDLKESTVDLFNQYAVETAKELTEDSSKLKIYDARNEVIKNVITAAEELKSKVEKSEKAVNDKQSEIDEINRQIDDLALTETEKAAADLKVEKEKELANNQTEKDDLATKQTQKKGELDELNQKLASTGLKDMGLRPQAYGSNAFASGDDSIAMGTNTTVISNDGIGIGRDTTVTGKESIAIGTNNTVASDNVVAIGSNITVGDGFNGSVVLGANSKPGKANPTESIEIEGTTYHFAGSNPTSVVSVGGSGEERQITNVAAGRISEDSTDAINGSQLYALAKAIEQKSVAPKDTVNIHQLNQQGNVINKRIDNLANKIQKNQKRTDAGIASTAAMANIPQVMLAGKSGVGVGVGHRSGQSAIAVGYSRASDNAKHIIKLSVGIDTQRKSTAGAGYMYQW
ncbi:YadA-like family protein [Ursidibacter sp. B-7004-1]